MNKLFTPCDSLWRRTAAPWSESQPLQGDVKADVAIIGAGYTGLAAALRLAEAGRDVAVVDAVEPGHGASGRNTGWWVPFWMAMTPDKAVARFGDAAGGRFVQMMLDGARLVPQLVKDHNIPCDLRPVGVICAAATEKTLIRLRRQAAEWRRFGAQVNDLSATDLRRYVATDQYIGGVHYLEAGHLQPLSYCRGLAAAAQKRGARIYGKSPAVAVAEQNGGWLVTTPMGQVTARQLLIATNAFPALLAQMKGKFIPLSIGMIASSPFPNHGRDYLPGDALVTDMDSHDMFAVAFDTGGRLVTSTLPPFNGARDPAHLARHYWRMFRRVFPDAPPKVDWEAAWQGDICVPSDMLVKADELAPGLFAAFGYSGNGIAQASMVGREMADWMLTGDRSRLRVPSMALKPVPLASILSALVNRALLPALNYAVYR